MHLRKSQKKNSWFLRNIPFKIEISVTSIANCFYCGYHNRVLNKLFNDDESVAPNSVKIQSVSAFNVRFERSERISVRSPVIYLKVAVGTP